MVKMYDKKIVDEFRQTLRDLKEKTPAERKLRTKEIIEISKEEIRRALKRGYTIEEIAQIARERGITISDTTLKSYTRESKGRQTARSARSRSRKKEDSVDGVEEKTDTVHKEDTGEGNSNESVKRTHAGFREDV